MKRMFDRAIMTKADLLLLAAALCAALLFVLYLSFAGREGSRVRVVCAGSLQGEYSLQEDREIALSLENGTNLLIIRNGQVWMEEADCPDGLCIRQGAVSRVGESIICLPHELVVTVEGEDGGDGLDGVAG